MSKCNECHYDNIDGANYCDQCGVDMTKSSGSPETVEPAGPPSEPVPEAGPPSEPIDDLLPGQVKCGVCGKATPIGPDSKFCEHCGGLLTTEEVPAVPAPLTAKFIVLDSPAKAVIGHEIPIPYKAEILIGRVDEEGGIFPDIDLDPYGAREAAVSREHAKLTLSKTGDQYILDQCYRITNWTKVNNRRLDQGETHTLADCDEIQFSKVTLKFVISGVDKNSEPDISPSDGLTA